MNHFWNYASKAFLGALLACFACGINHSHANDAEPTGDEILSRILKQFEDEQIDAAQESQEEFAKLGAKAKDTIPKLLILLERKEEKYQHLAIKLLGMIGPESKVTVDKLIPFLSHGNFQLQAITARTLGKIGPGAKNAAPQLIESLKKGNPTIRINSAVALGKIGPEIGEAGFEALLDAIQDKLHPVRAEAINALGKLGDLAKRAVPTLRPLMKKPELSVRSEVALAIWKLSGDVASTLPILIAELNEDTDPFVAAAAIGQMGPAAKDAVPALIAHLKSEDPDLRLSAATTLAEIGPAAQSALETLETLREDKDEDVRNAIDDIIKKIRNAK
jgi:HEAT repeat protein